MSTRSFWLLLVVGLANCGAPARTPDAGTADAGTADAGTSDAGTSDAGTSDAGTSDAGTSDAGTSDAGASDAGASDAGASWCTAPDWTCFEFPDGGAVFGQAVHEFDHRRWWWTPAQVSTFAVWPPGGDPRLSGVLRFVTLPGAARVERLPALGGVPADYREALADAGLVLSRPPLQGPALIITGHERYHLEEDGYGDFAWDLVRLDVDGGRWRGAGLQNADYPAWDSPVFLPAGGTVVEVLSDAPDNAPGGYDAGAVNNLVGVHLQGDFSLYLLHFRQGTIPRRDGGGCGGSGEPLCVEVGASLPAGAYLGRVGNSGVTLEPHLHLTLLAWDAERGRFFSVPAEFSGYYASPTGRDAGFVARGDPAGGEFLSDGPF